jgi:hypothetical protein
MEESYVRLHNSQTMRRVVLLAALAATVFAAPAWGAEGVTLSAQPRVAAYDGLVRLHGSTVPLAEVFLVQRLPAGWTVIGHTRAGTDGAFAFDGTDFLLEAKWQRSPVGAADLD